MLQYDFIQKLKSEPQAKDYGRLSVIGKTFLDIELLKKVPHSVFYPQPNVESGIVKLKFKQDLPDFLREPMRQEQYLEFIAGIFPYKNKLVTNSIGLFYEKLIKQPQDFPNISNKVFSKQGKKIGEIVTDILGDIKQKRLWELSIKEIQDLFWMLFVL
jgi:16S rRNA A1518/A1519 N6-dimethyltransferase RsmA/KsgA/DIM1 with predicted DNA glycosylase/AP lyase activity